MSKENKNIKKEADIKPTEPPKRRQGPGPGGPMGQMMKGEKAKDFKGTIKKLMIYLSPFKIHLIIVTIFAIASAVFGIIGPKMLGKATTKLFEGMMNIISDNSMGIDFDYIRGIILTLLGLYLFSAIFGYLQSLIMARVSNKVTYNFRKDISEKINRMPLNYFDKVSHGEVLSRITNDVDTVSQTLSQSLSQIISSVTTLVGVLVMMISISRLMTLVAILTLPLSFIFIMVIVKKSQKHFTQQQKSLGEVNGHIEEMYGGHMVMKAFNGEEASVKKFNKFNSVLYSSAWKSQFLSGLMMPIMGFIGNIGYVAMSLLGGYLAVNGSIAIGDIQAFLQYVRSFTQPISQVANISNVLQQTAAAAERVFEFFEQPEEAQESPTVKLTTDKDESNNEELFIEYTDRNNVVHKEKFSGNVTFKNVSFGYDPENIIIKNFSAEISHGQKVAIVGPTGAGKTTIVKLLMRFYELISGDIFIDGHNIKDFSRRDLRSMLGMVLQDTWLYNGTIRENIRYGKLNATDEEVTQAARAARVHHFVRTMPEGYDLVMNEESTNISQGQKQLMTIARALLADAKILILDEATSSVDTKTEVDIKHAMDRLVLGRTSFVIAHRLSTIRDADLILVMNNGDIIEQGKHEELLEKGGFYSELYNSQFDNSEAS